MPKDKYNSQNDSYRPGRKVTTPSNFGKRRTPASIQSAKRVPGHNRKKGQ